MKPNHALQALLPPVLLALCMGLPATAGAQAKAEPKTLTRDELRACFDSDDALAKRRDQATAAGDVISQEIKALEPERLAVEQAVKDAGDNAGRIERAERRQKRYNEQASAVAARLEAHRVSVETLKADLEAYNKRCANVPVLKEDKDAVLQERAAAGKK